MVNLDYQTVAMGAVFQNRIALLAKWDQRPGLRIQLLPHRDYLLSPRFKQSGYLDQYSVKLRSFLREILSEP